MAKQETQQTFLTRGTIVAAAILGLVALLGLGMLGGRALSDNGAESEPSTGTPTPTNPSSTSAPTGAAGSDCAAATPADVGGEDLPVTAPQTTWDQFGGGSLLMPTTAAGPFIKDSSLRRCYARTKLGALVAAANISMAVNSEPKTARAALEGQMTPGRMRDESLTSPGGSDPTAPRSFRLKGARILGYTQDRAVAEVVLDLNQGQEMLLTLPVTLLWTDGDWKVDGTNTTEPAATPSLDGFVQWEAGR